MRGFVGVMLIGILFLPSLVLGHPGKTDRRGGHACRKDCSEWDLYVGEYHLHEEDFKPVRTDENMRSKTTPTPNLTAATDEAKPPALPTGPANNLMNVPAEDKREVLPLPQPVSEKRSAIAPLLPEPEIFSLSSLWLLLTALGLIFLLAARIAKRKRSGE
jgi:hypothetical protein